MEPSTAGRAFLVIVFPQIGARWMSHVSVPDLDLLPARYPTLRTACFHAGLEVAPFHLALWSLSWLVRARLVRDLGALAAPLMGAKRWLRVFGSDRGGMFVTMRGRAADGNQKVLSWHLIASSRHGPYVPTIASVILAKRLAAGRDLRRGRNLASGSSSLPTSKLRLPASTSRARRRGDRTAVGTSPPDCDYSPNAQLTPALTTTPRKSNSAPRTNPSTPAPHTPGQTPAVLSSPKS